MDRIPLALVLTAFGFLSYVSLHHVGDLQSRLAELEAHQDEESGLAEGFETELAQALESLCTLRDDLAVAHLEQDDAQALAERLAETEGRLLWLDRALEEQQDRISLVSEAQNGFDPAALDANLQTLGEELEQRWDKVYAMAASAAELADESKQRLEELGRELDLGADSTVLWSALLGPVVQLSGEDSVGSGVLVRGPVAEGSSEEVDYVYTAWHVVRDIQGSLYNREMPVPVTVYLDEVTTREETATLLEFDPEIDVALLRLDSDEPVRDVAPLGTPVRLASISIFDRVYAVGCPLGNDPIPTLGQVASTRHVVDGETYLMINAPTYVGNSGGGIFDAETMELLGIFSKVYTHGSLRPTIVTHMGLVTPMDVVYQWMASTEWAFLAPAVEPQRLARVVPASPEDASAATEPAGPAAEDE